MTLAIDLLEQAEHLIKRERKRPKQDSLRRGISSAYYALFHLLTLDGARILTTNPTLRPQVARVFQHGDLKAVAKRIILISAAHTQQRQPGQQEKWLLQLLEMPIETDLLRVCYAFVNLQELRHKADYDLSFWITRREAATAVSQARAAHVSWKAIRHNHNAEIFLLAAAKVLVSR